MRNRLLETSPNDFRAHRDEGPVEPTYELSPGRILSAPFRWLCALTDIGRCRAKNEDMYFLSADCSLWILADGMGGHAAGEVASALTIQAIAETIQSAEPGSHAPRHLLEAFAHAQHRVCDRSRKSEVCRGMGSTVIAGIVDGEDLHLCHVGDVRAYHQSEGRFRPITNDHSWVWENLVASGLLTADQARFHPQRGKVLQAVGSSHGIRPELTRVTLRPGDRVLLCSDGLWELVGDQEIGAIVASGGSMRQLASVLVDRANHAGGHDNITVILYEHENRFTCF